MGKNSIIKINGTVPLFHLASEFSVKKLWWPFNGEQIHTYKCYFIIYYEVKTHICWFLMVVFNFLIKLIGYMATKKKRGNCMCKADLPTRNPIKRNQISS